MSLHTVFRRELGKIYITSKLGLAALFAIAAHRTGRSYSSVADIYADRLSTTLVAWIDTLPPRLALGVLAAPLLGYTGWKLLHVVDLLRYSVRRNGLLKTIAYVGGASIALVVVLEEYPELLSRGSEVRR